MLALYGHPFSSYTWKALIALYANGTEFEFRIVDGDHPEHVSAVQDASPLGTFPMLEDQGNQVFEATTIIEYLTLYHKGREILLPEESESALPIRMLDRVFDNYVMSPVQAIVGEHIRAPENPDPARLAEARSRLSRSYDWIEGWLEYYPVGPQVTLVECAAAPALFYADWVHPIGPGRPRLSEWRAHLLELPPVARCVEMGRPYRAMFPPGAPDRD
jgi:glutathione S-transferase